MSGWVQASVVERIRWNETLISLRFEAELDKIKASLASKRGKRKYEYVQERVIRLKERFKSVSSFYAISIEHEDGKAIHISYVCDRQDDLENKYSGSYCLRTSHMNLSNEKIWSLYMLLNTVESAFRTLKTDLNFRPVYHQKESRAEALAQRQAEAHALKQELALARERRQQELHELRFATVKIQQEVSKDLLLYYQ